MIPISSNKKGLQNTFNSWKKGTKQDCKCSYVHTQRRPTSSLFQFHDNSKSLPLFTAKYFSLFPATNIPEDMYPVFKFTELNFQRIIILENINE